MGARVLVAWWLAAFALCWGHGASSRPLTADNRLYFFVAERAASGVPPHVSLVDPKNQLGPLVTAAAIRAGRVVGVDDVVASRVASVASAASAVTLAAAFAALLAGSALAGHMAALALLATRGFADHAAIGSNPKVFLAAFAMLAHVAVARGRAADGARSFVVAGLAAGSAFLCWQPALVVVAAVALEAACAGSRALLAVLVAFATAVAGYEGWFALHGAMIEQLRQAYVMTLGSLHSPPRLGPALRYLATESGGPGAWPRVGPLAFAVVAAAALAVALRRGSEALATLAGRPGLLSFAAASSAATAFTLYDHQGLPDLFLPAPYFAVAAGLVASAVVRAAGRAGATRPASALVLAVLVLQAFHTGGRRPPTGYSLADQRRVASVLRGEVAAGRSVWAYEAVHLLALAHLDNHVPLALFFDDVEAVVDRASFRPLASGRLPDLVVKTAPGAPDLPGAGFVDVTPPDFRAQGLQLWRLEARSGPAGERADPDGKEPRGS